MASKSSFHRSATLLIVCATCWVANAQEQQARRQRGAISASSLNSEKVIGSLGRSLGEVVTVEGLVADENYTRRKAESGELLLRVQAVNGKMLRREVLFPFSSFPSANIRNPPAGTKFKYTGYETGGFTGIPEKAFNYVPRVSTTGYSFSTSFVVLRDKNVSN